MRRTLTSALAAFAFVFAGLAAPARARGQRPVGQPVGNAAAPVKLTLPVKDGSVRFMAVGDTGTGTEKQHQLAAMMLRYRQAFPFDFALLMGVNMYGEEYYRFKKGNVAFYALNSNYMDKKQVKWMEEQLAKDTSEWKIAFFHHPPYSPGGKRGSSRGPRGG